MASLCYFPSCFTISSRNLFLTQYHQQQPCKPILKQYHIHASATSKSRRTKKTKSDVELCNEIREFVATIGLPEDHVPSTKELLQHGRNDLANIVRRRGHKLIRELLASSLVADGNVLNMEKSLDEKVDAVEDSGNLLTGQNVEMDNTVDDVTPSAEISLDDSSSLDSAVSIMENETNTFFTDSDLKIENREFKPLESSIGLSLKQEDWSKLDGLDDGNNDTAEDVLSTKGVTIMEHFSSSTKIDSVVNSADDSWINTESSPNLSLEEKVAKFIQSGDLDPVEESKVNMESEYALEMPHRAHSAEHSIHLPKGDNALALKGGLLTSKQVVPSATMDHHLRDNHMRAEDLTAHFDKDLDVEATKGKNQSEIDHLKFMLHQKELELSRLKEQIEKEQLALSVLQTKAETEISKARKLISEKDAELHAAEESLSGLKEVQIQFCGDAEGVEVTGSFNGWQHRIKMDPQQSSSVIDHAGSRRSRLWSTMLWLYPGVYEVICGEYDEKSIRYFTEEAVFPHYHDTMHYFVNRKVKFIVDGHWRTDPQMESVTRGYICNNILRVDR